MSACELVTAHAILRYLTRIEGFDLAPIVRRVGRDAGNWAVAIAAAAALGVTLAEIQRRIVPPHLEAAVRGGAARIRREGIILHCAGGRVVTIGDEIHGGHAKMLSERELRQQSKRNLKRARR